MSYYNEIKKDSTPISVNELYMKRKSSISLWSLKEFDDRSVTRMKFNDHLPFQRENVWDKKMQISLIDSLMKGRHVNNIILSCKIYENGLNEYRIIDGKQRFNSIKNFIIGDLKVPFKIGDETKEMSYKDLTDEDRLSRCHKDVKDILSHIDRNVKMGVCIYEDLDDNMKEYDEFLRQNTAKFFTSNEKVFCYRPKTKYILTKIWKFYISSIFKKIVSDEKSEKSRYVGIRWLSYIMHYYMSSDLKCCKLSYETDLDKNDGVFLDNFENILNEYDDIDIENNYDDKLDKENIDIALNKILVNGIPLMKIIKNIKSDLEKVEKIYKATGRKILKQRTLDFIIFLKNKKDVGSETDSTISNDINFWKEVFIGFLNDEKIVKKHINPTIRGCYMKERYDLLNDYYLKISEIKGRDLGIKEKPFPQEVLDFLKKSSTKYNWKCPYYNDEINEEINHYPPKSKSSMCFPIIISKKANGELKNYTIERKTIEFDSMLNYAKNCGEDIKNEIPDNIKDYFDYTILEEKKLN